MASIPAGSSSQREGAFERERIPPTPASNEPSVAELLSGLIEDAQHLVRREVDLAKKEVTIELDKVKQGAIALGAGLGIAIVGGILLAHMLVYLVQDLSGLALWIAYLIVGAVFAIIGGVLLQRGAKRMQDVDPVPHETIESVRKDIAWIQEQNPSDKI
jgi:hypothetical protein